MAGTRGVRNPVDHRGRTDGYGDVNASITSADSDASTHSDQSGFNNEGRVDDSDLSDPASTDLKESAAEIVTGASFVDRVAKHDDVGGNPKHQSSDSAVVFSNASPDPSSKIAETSNSVVSAAPGSNLPSLSSPAENKATSSSYQSRSKESLADRRKREHEEYKRLRDSDPTFVPNRGNFFMHDARSIKQKHRPLAHNDSGCASKFASRRGPLADSRWAHDLHETVNEPDASKLRQRPRAKAPKTHRIESVSATPPTHLCQSRHIGNVQVRTRLPDMSEAKLVTAKIHVHVLLPTKYPRMRNDKGFRIAIPNTLPTFVMPANERNHVDAHTQLQQQSVRSSDALKPGGGQDEDFSDGWRSSVLQDSRRSPSVQSRVPSALSGTKPIVRMPRASSPLKDETNEPLVPHVECHREISIMHQPSPRKGFAVNDIDTKAALSLHIPTSNHAQQPFENQLPRGYQFDSSSVASLKSYSGTQSATDPYYSDVPHGGSHGPFVPAAQMAGAAYYGMPYMPAHLLQSPMSMYGPQFPYTPDTAFAALTPGGTHTTAHESNGMIYYVHDQSQTPMLQMMFPPPHGCDLPMPVVGGPTEGMMMADMYYPPTNNN